MDLYHNGGYREPKYEDAYTHSPQLQTEGHIAQVQFRTDCVKREEDAHSGCEGPTVAIS
jgi:hypothetical protein